MKNSLLLSVCVLAVVFTMALLLYRPDRESIAKPDDRSAGKHAWYVSPDSSADQGNEDATGHNVG